MTGLGIFAGFVLGLACSTRKGKEFRNDLWEGYRTGGIIGKWKVVNKELSASGQEFINMIDELFHSPEIKSAIEKGKTKLEELQKEGSKKVKSVRKTIAKKATSTAKKKPVIATRKPQTRKTTTTRKKSTSTAKKPSNTMKRTVRKIS